MTNKTISQFPPVSGLSGAEKLVIDQTDGLGNVGTFYCTTVQVAGLSGAPLVNPQGANLVLAGPVSGPATVPTFRPLVGADLPPIPPPDLPTPTPTTLGGVKSYGPVANQFLTAIDTTGQPISAQPSAANLTNGTTGSGLVVLQTSPALITPALGTPTSGNLASCTGLPISTGVGGLAAGVATFLGTPTSANLAAAVTDETGTAGSVVFSAGPTFTGVPLAPTAAPGTNTTQLATTGFVAASFLTIATASATYAPLASPALTGTPTAPTAVAGDVSTKIATTAFVSAASVNTAGAGNILRRNGGLELWQRGAGGSASFAVPAGPATTYTADGWYLLTSANQASTVAQLAGLTNGSQWSAKVQRNSGQTGTSQQIFGFPLDTDEMYPMLGQFVTLSLTLKAGANWSPASGNLDIRLVVGTGSPVKLSSGFTGAANAVQLIQAITTTTTRYQATSAAIVPITTRQAEISLLWTPVGTAGADDSFTVDDVQLEIVPAATGYVASNFQRLNFEEQLLLCQRHFFKSFLYTVAPAQNAGTSIGEVIWQNSAAGAVATASNIRYPVLMRTNPTLTLFNPSAANAQPRNIPAAADCTGAAASLGNSAGFVVAATQPAGAVVGGYNGLHITADSGI